MMNRSGIGVGSASVILVFAILCLTVFSLITFVVALNEKNLVEVQTDLVTGYYEADALAELILADILTADTVPATIRGVNIYTGWDDELGVETTYYFCHISDIKALYVNLAVSGGSFDILSWRMYDTDSWEYDGSLNLWTGD